MMDPNRYLTLILSVVILVKGKRILQRTRWTDNTDACIYQNNDKEIEKVYSMGQCKNLCKDHQWCRSVELYRKDDKCVLSRVTSRTNRLIEPCQLPSVTYSEMIDNSAADQATSQGVRNGGSGGCTQNKKCPDKKVCNSGICVSPCEVMRCGQGAMCQVSKGKAQCYCPISTTGNPLQLCQPIIGCNSNTQCESNKICEKGRCVNPCELINCGEGARCQTSGRHPKCICPENTQGDPNVQCQPRPECTQKSPCRIGKRCISGSCVDACKLAKCGEGATCQFIHGSPQCSCPARTIGDPQKQCFSTQDTLDCQFPFIYKDTQYSACTREGDPEEKFWCSTKTNNEKNHLKGNWRHCTGCELAECEPGATCQVFHAGPHVQCISSQGTSVCQFPFIYRDINYSSCTVTDDPEGKLWCSTKTDKQNNHLRGNWKHCPNNSGVGDRNINSNTASNSPVGNIQTGPHLQFNKPAQGPIRQPGCLSLPDPGECRGAFPRFYYNQQTDQCDCFLFGGCDEERVKFTWLSFEECLGTCVPTNKAKGPGCQRVTLEEVQRFLG